MELVYDKFCESDISWWNKLQWVTTKLMIWWKFTTWENECYEFHRTAGWYLTMDGILWGNTGENGPCGINKLYYILKFKNNSLHDNFMDLRTQHYIKCSLCSFLVYFYYKIIFHSSAQTMKIAKITSCSE